MKTPYKLLALFLITTLLASCSVETETHMVKTPVLELKAIGPLFQGSNTATVTWEYSLNDLFPNIKNEIVLEHVRIDTIKIIPKSGTDYPKIGTVVMEMKPKNTDMSRIALLDKDFNNDQANTLNVAEVQEDFDEAFKDERLTFVADFEMLDDEYYEDLSFDLIVTFEIQTRK